MKIVLRLILLIPIFLFSCTSQTKKESIEKWKNEIIEAEKNFAEMARKDGIPQAFLTFAAEDAVLMRNNRIIVGKEALQKSYEANKSIWENVNLTWKPDFVDVSSSGDLGYTYGSYTLIVTDSTGNSKTDEGIFHTVWKRQADGKWLFVWD